MSILRPALLRFSFAFQMPPLGLLVALLSHGLASMANFGFFSITADAPDISRS